MPKRVAALYDIHGNLPALEAVLEELKADCVDRIVVGGDVLPGPMPTETLRALRALDVPVDFVRGNGEREVLEALAGRDSSALRESVRAVLRWTGDVLSSDDRRRIASWPATVRLDIPGLGRALFCHATPRSDAEIFTGITPADALLPVFHGLSVDLVVCGHTHMSFDRQIGDVRVLNVGSVGMPFGEPGAYWALLGPGVELRRTPFDLDAAAARIHATDYPDAALFAEGNVRSPPSEEAMLETLERAAISG